MNMSEILAPVTANDLKRAGLSTLAQFAAFLGMSEGTARKRLDAAIEAGLVTKFKTSSGTIYYEAK